MVPQCLLLLLLQLLTGFCAEAVPVRLSTTGVDILLGQNSGFNVSLADRSARSVPVRVYVVEGADVLASPRNVTFWLAADQTRWVNVSAVRVGHAMVAVESDGTERFVDVNVSKVRWLNLLSAVFGWIYFTAWSVSFYPQIYVNWKKKSVAGLNLDFVYLNVTGFVAYALFSVDLFFDRSVQEEYLSYHRSGGIPVEINDVVFSLHATLASAVTGIQCLVYERGEQTLSPVATWSLFIVQLTALIFVLFAASNVRTWLYFLEFVSIIKLIITLVKYIPQAYYNFRRKSTVGWSIEGIFLDFTGGTFSMLQMFLIAYNFDDWTSLFGNVTKFGLGAASIAFDIVFLLQHYVFYRHKARALLADTDDSQVQVADGSQADDYRPTHTE